jgi:hypothetical protein
MADARLVSCVAERLMRILSPLSSWAASMIIAGAVVARNPYLTFPQKVRSPSFERPSYTPTDADIP